ncbi:MAG: hypothetical protein EXQ57_02390 [Bryobacterales bacterium]|nr:hypothetical protein [Bryobacterales bacterium]
MRNIFLLLATGLAQARYFPLEGGNLWGYRVAEVLRAEIADGAESMWPDFNAAEGASYPTAFDTCTGRGRVEKREATAEILDRIWASGIQISYSATNCADAGVTDDL